MIRTGKEKSLPATSIRSRRRGRCGRCPGRDRARVRPGARRKCQSVRHLEEPIPILIALDAATDLKYQTFRISLSREVRVRPEIMLGPQHQFHFALAGSFMFALGVSVGNRLLEPSFWRRCWTRVSSPVQRRPRLRARGSRIVRRAPDRHLGGKDGRADRLHPGRPKSPLSSTGSTPCIVSILHRAADRAVAVRDGACGLSGSAKRGGDRADLEEAIRIRLARADAA